MDFLLKLKCSTQAACLYKNGSLEKGRDIRKHNLFVAVLLPMLYLLFLILLELGFFTFLEKMRIRMHALLVLHVTTPQRELKLQHSPTHMPWKLS